MRRILKTNAPAQLFGLPPPPALEIHKPRFSCHISATTPEIHISNNTTSHIHPASTTAGRDSAETPERSAKTKHCYRVQHVRVLNVSDGVMSRGVGRARTQSLFQLSNWGLTCWRPELACVF